MEYKPSDLGYGNNLDQDFRGQYWSTQAQFFLAYGLTDCLALQVETSHIRARLDKSPSDTSAVPARIDETGLADLRGAGSPPSGTASEVGDRRSSRRSK